MTQEAGPTREQLQAIHDEAQDCIDQNAVPTLVCERNTLLKQQSALEKKVAELAADRERLVGCIRHAHYYVKNYDNDSKPATHAKRALFNMLHAIDTARDAETP